MVSPTAKAFTLMLNLVMCMKDAINGTKSTAMESSHSKVEKSTKANMKIICHMATGRIHIQMVTPMKAPGSEVRGTAPGFTLRRRLGRGLR